MSTFLKTHLKTYPEKKHQIRQGKRGSYWITTFGCQMNKADSERMAGILEQMGYQQAKVEFEADLVLYNTCTIRDSAEQKVYSYLGRQAKRKHLLPHLKLIIAGCVAQQEGESLLRRVPELDLVMGPQHVNRLETLLNQVDNGQQVVATEENHILEDLTTARRDSSISAWVNIIYGCNERCTYCVVPSVRGNEQSRMAEDIKVEIEQLASSGFKEITLLGQNIDAYGRDLESISQHNPIRNTLTDLLKFIHNVEGINRIRFATSHPRYFTDRLIRTCYELDKVCEHFHIPFQSGDNQILKAMGRGYSTDRYKEIIEKIRSLMPSASITADAIVAFPGESDAQFKKTIDLIQEIGFDLVNTAAYSPRPNTPAATWENQIEESVKVSRLRELNSVVESTAIKRNQRYLGKHEEILVEGINPKDKNQLMGRTRSNRLTFFSTTNSKGGVVNSGQLVNVLIQEARAFSLSGTLSSGANKKNIYEN